MYILPQKPDAYISPDEISISPEKAIINVPNYIVFVSLYIDFASTNSQTLTKCRIILHFNLGLL